MKVSVSWLGFIIIIIFVAYFGIYGRFVYEAFKDPISEGFADIDDLQITTCPVGSNRFINKDGLTLCCDGAISSSKCSGKSICSLSGKYSNIPSCTEWYKTYLHEKGLLRCPTALPNYYQEYNNSYNDEYSNRYPNNAGCTVGSRKKDGSAPLTPSQEYCKIYNNQSEDESNIDSCSNRKLLDSSTCFFTAVPHSKKLVFNGIGKPATVQCSYVDKDYHTYTCTTDKSMEKLVSKNLPPGQTLAEWKAGSAFWDPLYSLQFCSGLESYKITKKIAPTITKTEGPNPIQQYCYPIFRFWW